MILEYTLIDLRSHTEHQRPMTNHRPLVSSSQVMKTKIAKKVWNYYILDLRFLFEYGVF